MQVGDDIYLQGEIIRLDDAYPRSNKWTWFKLRDRNGRKYHISGIVLCPIEVGLVVGCNCIAKSYSDKYGWSYEVQDISLDVVAKYDVIRYLSSSLFDGVGKSTAIKLYDAFGKDTIDMLMNHFDVVCNTVSLTQKQKDSLGNIAQYNCLNKLKKRFPSLSDKAQDVIDYFLIDMGRDIDDLIQAIEYNPYILNKVVPFEVIDKVVIQDCNIPLHDIDRMSFVIGHYIGVVNQHFNNTYVSSVDELDMLAQLVFNRPMPQSAHDGAAKYGSKGQWLFYEMQRLTSKNIGYFRKDVRPNNDIHFYTATMFELKKYLAQILLHIIRSSQKGISFYMKKGIQFQNWIQNQSMMLNKEQRLAVQRSVTNQLSFISGGPGRGKTYTANALLNFWMSYGDGNVLLLAPTGRAANKLKTETGYSNTETIARFVCMNKEYRSDVFIDTFHNEMSKKFSTLVIIDEVSMLDIEETVQLLKLIGRCTVVFLGDINQLPPIEPGNFLSEILKIDKHYSLPISYLTKNMRTNVPVLADNADRVLDGSLNPSKHFDANFVFDFTFCGTTANQVISVDDADRLTCEKAFDYYMDALKNGYDKSDILLLCPTRKGCAGVIALNQYFQNNLNPISCRKVPCQDVQGNVFYSDKGVECNGFKVGGMSIRVMDRLMRTVNDAECEWVRFEDNNPDKDVVEHGFGVFNGDVCTIVRYYEPMTGCRAKLLLQFDDNRFVYISSSKEICEAFCLGYALTVHKAQGSEAKCVIMVLPELLNNSVLWFKIPFLTKNLLYTGFTRAKESVQIVGSYNALRLGLNTEQYISKCTVADDVIINMATNYVC